MSHARALAALSLVLAGFALVAALLLPNPGANAARPAEPAAAPVQTPHAGQAVHAGGTAVSSTVDADEAFLADLTDGQPTDLLPMPVEDLIALAHRTCDLPNRDGYVSALATSGWTASEAGKLLDTAAAAYCPETLAP